MAHNLKSGTVTLTPWLHTEAQKCGARAKKGPDSDACPALIYVQYSHLLQIQNCYKLMELFIAGTLQSLPSVSLHDKSTDVFIISIRVHYSFIFSEY